MQDKNPDDPILASQIEGLRNELSRLLDHRYLESQSSTLRMLWSQLLRGLAFGLGSVLGASILVSILGYLLAQIDFIPILGEWTTAIAEQLGFEIPASN